MILKDPFRVYYQVLKTTYEDKTFYDRVRA